MLNIQIEKVNAYNFTGYIYRDELTDAQKLLFPGDNATIDIEGDFYVNELEPEIYQVLAFCGKAHLYLEASDYNAEEVLREVDKKVKQYASYYDSSEYWAGV